MEVAPQLPNEPERLDQLHQCLVLDTAPEADFDGIVALAARLSGCPVALVSLIDGTRQWFKARVGLQVLETPRSVSFCGHAIASTEASFTIEDTRLDVRFADNPLVVNAPHVIFYSGIPLRVGVKRLAMGTLCVIDHEPRKLSPQVNESLRILARQIELMLESRQRTSELEAALRLLREREQVLEAARATADEAVRARSEFLATMSHELRTPMNGVIGITDLLLAEGVENEHQRELLVLVRDSGHALLTVINDVLDYSTIQAGGRELSAAPIDPRRLTFEVTRLLAPEVLKKGLHLEVGAWSTSRLALADPQAVRQVLMNLVGNAVKFSKSGLIRVSFETLESCCRVTVEDTGVGVRAEHLPKLFQRFSQAESSTARTYGGTGLGLAICKKLIQSMRGEIGVESEFGRGSRFWFTLPLAEPNVVAPEVTVRAPLATLERSLKVLLVEDSTVNQLVTMGMLKRLGHTCDLVTDGFKAVEAASALPYDLILMDVQMAGMDGLDATRAIRRDELEGHRMPIPICALTASVMQDERAACLAAGMTDVLAKPLTLKALSLRLTELFQ